MTQLEDSVSKAVSHFTLEVVQPRVISFEDQVAITAQSAVHMKYGLGGRGETAPS